MYVKIKQVIRRFWLIFFFLLIALIVLLSGISITDILASLLTLQLWQLFLLVVVFFMATGLHIISRKYLFYALGADCGLKNLSYIHFSTLAAHYSTPVKIGIPVAIYLFNKIENIEYSKSTAMLFVEIAVSTSLCGLIALVGIPAILGFSLPNIIGFIFIGALSLFFIFLLFNYLHKKIGKQYKLLDYLYQTIGAMRCIKSSKLGLYLILSILLRLVDGLNLFLLCWFFLEELTIWESVMTTSTAFFIGTISMIPMSLGSRDISILLLLQHYNVANQSSVLIVSLQRILTTGLSFVLGIYCGSVLGVKNAQVSIQDSAKNQN